MEGAAIFLQTYIRSENYLTPEEKTGKNEFNTQDFINLSSLNIKHRIQLQYNYNKKNRRWLKLPHFAKEYNELQFPTFRIAATNYKNKPSRYYVHQHNNYIR